MKKKLSVIVVHYYDHYYTVKYCIYYIFPLFYHNLYNYWDHIIGYNQIIGNHTAMEYFAERLTIPEIRRIQDDAYNSRLDYLKKQREQRLLNRPYYCKRIK